MAETDRVSMTKQEFVAFAQKLEAWGQGLTAKEQDFLEEILARAAASTSGEVEGFMTKTELTPRVTTTTSPDWWLSVDQGRFSKMVLPFDDGSLAP